MIGRLAVAGAAALAWCAACGSGGSAPGAGGSGGGAGSDGGGSGAVVTHGQTYQGGMFHLGPVEWAGSIPNACAPSPDPYPASVQQAEGALLAGLWGGIPDVASYCDACIRVVTAKGKTAVLSVVTYGDTTTNSIDVSPDAYAILNSGPFRASPRDRL